MSIRHLQLLFLSRVLSSTRNQGRPSQGRYISGAIGVGGSWEFHSLSSIEAKKSFWSGGRMKSGSVSARSSESLGDNESVKRPFQRRREVDSELGGIGSGTDAIVSKSFLERAIGVREKVIN